MEENVALEKSSQSAFTKAFKNLKKDIKKGVVQVRPSNKKEKDTKSSDRGVVYLSHIPHGFYEESIHQYFTQFGKITGVKLVRSKKTGRSCGYAFVQFLHPEVAKVAAETMNNYLMCDRIIKATYIPPEEQKEKIYAGVHTIKKVCLRERHRAKHITRRNGEKALEQEKLAGNKMKRSVRILQKKLALKGITYNFKAVNDPGKEDETEELPLPSKA